MKRISSKTVKTALDLMGKFIRGGNAMTPLEAARNKLWLYAKWQGAFWFCLGQIVALTDNLTNDEQAALEFGKQHNVLQ